jgi:hypothetical protein
MNNHTPAKRAYAPPSLVVYGAFTKLTSGGSVLGREATGMGNEFRRA